MTKLIIIPISVLVFLSCNSHRSEKNTADVSAKDTISASDSAMSNQNDQQFQEVDFRLEYYEGKEFNNALIHINDETLNFIRIQEEYENGLISAISFGEYSKRLEDWIDIGYDDRIDVERMQVFVNQKLKLLVFEGVPEPEHAMVIFINEIGDVFMAPGIEYTNYLYPEVSFTIDSVIHCSLYSNWHNQRKDISIPFDKLEKLHHISERLSTALNNSSNTLRSLNYKLNVDLDCDDTNETLIIDWGNKSVSLLDSGLSREFRKLDYLNARFVNDSLYIEHDISVMAHGAYEDVSRRNQLVFAMSSKFGLPLLVTLKTEVKSLIGDVSCKVMRTLTAERDNFYSLEEYLTSDNVELCRGRGIKYYDRALPGTQLTKFEKISDAIQYYKNSTNFLGPCAFSITPDDVKNLIQYEGLNKDNISMYKRFLELLAEHQSQFEIEYKVNKLREQNWSELRKYDRRTIRDWEDIKYVQQLLQKAIDIYLN